MFLSSLIEELYTEEENNKVGCTLTFGGPCILNGRINENCFQGSLINEVQGKIIIRNMKEIMQMTNL